jgi:glutamine cyclotransferase
MNRIALLVAFYLPLFLSCLTGVCDARQTGRQTAEYTLRIIKRIAHSPRNFTQGLLYFEGKLYESTGLVGKSTLQRLDPETGVVEKIVPVPNAFAEGLALFDNRLIQLTWRSQKAFVYNVSDFSLIGKLPYRTEGWGLTSDGRSLIMSDGTDVIYYRNPDFFIIERKILVTLQGVPVRRINELEYAEGKIFANIWMEKHIVRIDPSDGKVDAVIDASLLFQSLPKLSSGSVLNGIAYNPVSKTFFLTGKNWPLIFEVILVPNKS